jgi:membrane associated rhomboid family serine protease
MIPLRDENPIRIFPFITLAIIFANLLVLLYELNPSFRFEEKIFLFGAVPYRITHLHSPLVLITLLSSLFFHADFFHLAGNMLYLWVFGNSIEDKLGHLRFAYFYLACGIVASFTFILITPDSKLPLIGASGAISGILGAYFLLYPDSKIVILVPLLIFWRRVRISAFWFLLIWVGLQFYYGITSFNSLNKEGQAWFAHILGFIAGALFLTLFSRRRR